MAYLNKANNIVCKAKLEDSDAISVIALSVTLTDSMFRRKAPYFSVL